MKRTGLFLVLCVMLILSLTACGSKPADTDSTIDSGTSVAERAKARTRTMMDEGKRMMQDAKYFAAPNGRVRGTDKSDLMAQMRSAGANATDRTRHVGDTMDNTHSDMPKP